MSLASTKANIQQLIEDENNGVIALSGKWGTGKSYLWQEVQKSSMDKSIENALYVSLFGIRDITQLKLKIVQSAIPDTKTGHVARELMVSAWRQGTKILKAAKPGFAALDEIALMAVPALLRNRFIVIDDIERKHPQFDIGEVMGFIDEYTQIYDARVLLILNSDQLSDKDLWETLREKVIDHEVALETTPEEAFDIAITNNPSTWAAPIRAAVTICKISNIRIIYKIIRTVNRLLSNRSDLTDGVLKRIVPSTVLLSAIHYKGLNEGPNFDYLLKFNSMSYHMAKVEKVKKAPDETEEDRCEARWALIMENLNINSCDEYENLVIAFLKSGLLDAEKVSTILDQYVAEGDTFDTQQRCRAFFDKELWDPECTETELFAEAAGFVPVVHFLDMYSVSSLHRSVVDFTGGKAIADQMIADWLTKFREKDHTGFTQDNFFKRELHPDIESELATLDLKLAPAPSLPEICRSIIENSGWGTRHEDAMKSSTPAQYEAEIKRLAGGDLKTFMLKSMDLYVNRITYAKHFGDAMWHFVAACRRICHENANPRRSKMIRLVFSESRLASLLDVYDGPVPVAMTGYERSPNLIQAG